MIHVRFLNPILSVLFYGGTLLLFSSCATTGHHSFEQKSTEISPQSSTRSFSFSNPTEADKTGRASWYGRRFHRRKTASGERFNMFDFTAAHRNLPFGSKLRVRNLKSGKSVVVRVNDRGPASKSRLVDVSYAAGKALGIVSSGIAPVEIEILKK